MIPTLVLGLGGRGVHSLRFLKELYQEVDEVDRGPARFLAIDQSLQTQPNKFAGFHPDEFASVNPRDIRIVAHTLAGANGNQLAWGPVLKWLPLPERRSTHSNFESDDCLASRSMGRLGFHIEDETIDGTIRRALCRLEMADNCGTRVFLICGLGGGTGSGMLLNILYNLRTQQPMTQVSIFLLLPHQCKGWQEGSMAQGNLYACLKELHHLRAGRITFKAEYEHIASVTAESENPLLSASLFLFDTCEDASQNMAERNLATAILPYLTRSVEGVRHEKYDCTLAPLAEEGEERYWNTAAASFLELKCADLDKGGFINALKDIYDDIYLEMSNAGHEVGSDKPADSSPTASPMSNSHRSYEIGACVNRWKEQLSDPIEKFRDAWTKSTIKELEIVSSGIDKKDDATEADRENIKEFLNHFRSILLENDTNALVAISTRQDWRDKEDLLSRSINRFLETELSGKSEREMLIILDLFRQNQAQFAWDRPQGYGDFRGLPAENWKAVDNHIGNLGKNLWWMWKRFRLRMLWQREVRHKCALLLGMLKRPEVESYLTRVFGHLASTILGEALKEKSATIERRISDREAERASREERDGRLNTRRLPVSLRNKIEALVREDWQKILIRAEELPGLSSDDPAVWQPALSSLFRETRAELWWKREAQWLIDYEGGEEARLRELVGRCVQRVFVDPPLRPRRRSCAFALIPQGLYWPYGLEGLTAFLEQECHQALGCSCKVYFYTGQRLWIQYEDRYNSPCEILLLKSCRQAYHRERYPEVFHIDRRFVEVPAAFTELCEDDASVPVLCGNSGCRESLAQVPRDALVCPGCHFPILSRCGNLGCSLDDLHLWPNGKTKSCPDCGGFNHAAWWPCRRHGKNPVAVPIDKERCPDCIRSHQEDPLRFPTQSIGVRPDLEAIACPKCLELAEKDSAYDIFYVRTDLLPFYMNGVNGHDSAKMAALVQKYTLLDGFRCPNCQTHLIPVHHACLVPSEVNGPQTSRDETPTSL
jgi:hypothetical protein